MGTPPAEVSLTVDWVRSLLQSQHPDLADLPLQLAASGYDNVMFRLGDRWAVRMPRRKLGAVLIEKEQTWLPLLSPQLTLPVPQPVRLGVPGSGYPWRWSVVPWMQGQTADLAPLNVGEAERLAAFLRSLHTPAPDNAPFSPHRGVPLASRSEHVTQWMSALAQSSNLITPAIKKLWQRACRAPAAADRFWLHSDLHPHNVLVVAGRLSGVIDWGDLTAGDVATDLATIWMLFDSQGARQQAIKAYGADDGLVLRAQGWAIFFATILLKNGLVDNPSHAAIGRNTLRRLAEDSS